MANCQFTPIVGNTSDIGPHDFTKSDKQRSGRMAQDICSQVDFMPALTYQRANIPGWYITGSRASA